MTHTLAAARTLKHAAEHDAGTCPNDCLSTADEFREVARQLDVNAGRRFSALDDEQRRTYARAARFLVETERAPEPEDDFGLEYARRYGLISAVLEELLDLVGLAPEELADPE